MPEADFEAKNVIPGNEISMRLNEDMLVGMQASESYSVSAEGESVLGSGGETRAFGKYNFDPNTASPMVAANIANSSGPLFNNANMSVDESIGGDRNLLTRAVATSQLDQHLGLNILAEEKFAMKDGRMAGISVQVDGAGMTGKYEMEVDGQRVETHAFLGISPEDSGIAISDGLRNDASIPDHIKGYANPGIQKGLSDLEVMDYISGQIDRHPGNIFIDPANGKVKGIDNDLAFPERNRAQVLAGDVDLRAKMVQGLPSVIHKDTAEKILKADPEGVRRMLGQVQRPDGQPGLSAQEINGAVERLKELQNAIKNPASVPGFQVVAQFNEATFRQAFERQNQAFQQQYGNNMANAQAAQLGHANRTSYLGSAVLTEKQKALEMQVQPDGNAIRPGNTVGQAARKPEYVEYAKMLEVAKQDLKAKPQLIADPAARQQVVDLKQQIADVKAKIAHYEKETVKLEDGGLGARFRSLASGGPEGRKEFYAEKKLAAQQQLAGLERQLDAAAANAVPLPMKQGLMEDATAAVAARQPQQAVAQNNNAVQPDPVLLANPPQHPAPPPPGELQPDPVLLANAPQYPAPPPPGELQPDPALLANAPQHPAPPPPGQFNHPPPQDPAPAPPDLDNLAQQNDQPKVAKAKIPAKDKAAGDEIKAAENEPEVAELDDVGDLEQKVDAEVKQEQEKKPSVAEVLKRSQSSPALGGHREAQGQAQGQEGEKPKANSLRASGSWQPAKPSAPKPGGASLTKSH